MIDKFTTSRRTVLGTTATLLCGAGLTATAVRSDSMPWNPMASNDLELVARHDADANEHGFDLSTKSLPSGWRTVTLDNATGHTHFAYFARLPQVAIDEAAERGVSVLQHYVERVTRPFQYYMDTLTPGKEPNQDDFYEGAEELFPAWFSSVAPSGGVGLTSPGETAATTLHLDPGQYIVECYIKNADNDFHSYHGMIDHFTVTGVERSSEPKPTLSATVSTAGIVAPATVRPGRHVVGVTFEDQQVYSHLLGHDLHLVRLDDETPPADVSRWMNWSDPTQFVSDGSEPGTFVGGVETILTPELLDGEGTETAYLDVVLKPGEYAWVAEVPDPARNGLLRTFEVAERSG